MSGFISFLSILLASTLFCYLIGAFPFGYWIGLANGVNLLEIGSKSTGATNVLRAVGKWQAALCLTLDILKGFIPIWLVKNFYLQAFLINLFGWQDSYFHTAELINSEWIVLFLSIVPIIAHSKSIFLNFKGGKSSATGFGILLALNWKVALITIVIWIASVKITKYSSMGSIVAIPFIPLWLWLFHEKFPIICFGIIAFIYIVLIKHRGNIERLLNGTEPKVGEKS